MEEGNKLTLKGVIEQVEVAIAGDYPPAPFVINVNWAIASLWTRTDQRHPEQIEARTVYLSPSGLELSRGEFAVDLERSQRFRSLAKISELPVDGAGIYTFRIETRAGLTDDWIPVGRNVLQVVIKHNGATLL